MERLALFLLLLASCYAISDKEFNARMDQDSDGVPGTEDCDDQNPNVGTAWYQDLDGDGYGTPLVSLENCEKPEEGPAAWKSGDCDDSDTDVNPDALELCDGADNDCDGDTDEDDARDAATWTRDQDGDGFGAEGGATVVACGKPSGYATSADDCDDEDDAIHPDADEACNELDDDCDEEVDEDFDADDDEHLDKFLCSFGDDCDDTNASINPDAEEVCDNADNDCDGDTDEDDAVDASTWYEDADQDGYGDPETAVNSCVRPSRYANNGDDCDDDDVTAYPGSPETCDRVDDDCDDLVDEDFDVDGDGYQSEEWCADQGGEDCDDADNSSYPGAPDPLGDDIDQNCNGHDG